MIYLSAQPAEYYYLWQLQIQLFNFQRLGIKKGYIHVLFGYKETKEIDERLISFVKNYAHLAHFYFYEDNRPPSAYEPTIRPHIIKQHFAKFPELENEYIFYHDCDIIFREIPNFKKLTKGNTWYMSATDYIEAELISSVSPVTLENMIKIVGVDREKIFKQKYTGGAQSLIKGTNFSFWEKVEFDSHKINQYLSAHINEIVKKFQKDTNSKDSDYGLRVIQPWCADMWALLWNGILFGFNIETHDELKFCWSETSETNWFSTKIMHNAGITFSKSHSFFYKSLFRDKSPFTTTFEYVKPDSCSRKYVDELEGAAVFYRHKLTNVSFLIIVRIDSKERYDNLISITNYINAHFDTKIFVLEADSQQRVDSKDLKNVDYEFIHDLNDVFNRAKYNNHLLDKCTTDIAILQDTDLVVDMEQIKKAVCLISEEQYRIVCPYDRYICISDPLTKQNFKNCSDVLLLENDHKAVKRDYYAVGGIVVLDKLWYRKYGYENKYIGGYGPDDIERIVRTIILGGKFTKVKGNLYHFDHPRNSNSCYAEGEFTKRYEPLLKVLSMNNDELLQFAKNELV